jgi:hypothetical protein
VRDSVRAGAGMRFGGRLLRRVNEDGQPKNVAVITGEGKANLVKANVKTITLEEEAERRTLCNILLLSFD